MAVATIANLAAVPTASLAYLKAARLESSPQSASSSLRVRSISSQSASSSSSSPRVRASKCNCFERILINPGCHHFSQDAVLRAERAHHHRINASLNEVHVGNQASELVRICVLFSRRSGFSWLFCSRQAALLLPCMKQPNNVVTKSKPRQKIGNSEIVTEFSHNAMRVLSFGGGGFSLQVLINASVQQFLDTHAKCTSESYSYYSCYPSPPPPPPD